MITSHIHGNLDGMLSAATFQPAALLGRPLSHLAFRIAYPLHKLLHCHAAVSNIVLPITYCASVLNPLLASSSKHALCYQAGLAASKPLTHYIPLQALEVGVPL
eukprot:922262-Pelagomonas_calceolata.AAC.6